ncbi:MAG: hypothetical protein E6Q97_31260 [Desulfurellales bacterium]|nr:MAG: hypothetical protein E6Q97_31260 [Desulfurellales bacterium]
MKQPDGENIVRSHAVIRWIERVMGVDLTLHREAVRQVCGSANNERALFKLLVEDGYDMEAIRASILSDKVKEALALGLTAIPVGGGFILVVRDGRIVSVLDAQVHSLSFARGRHRLRMGPAKVFNGRRPRQESRDMRKRRERFLEDEARAAMARAKWGL